MHPALSVIVFTTFSGMGYGLFIWLCANILRGNLPFSENIVIGSAMSFSLVTIGLLSSTAHLGRPERAWRAFSQWRTSWLSREGIMSLLTFGPIVSIGGNAYLDLGLTALITPLAILGIVGSVLTIFTTSMIYASIKAIPAWHNKWVVIGYQINALASGGVAYIMVGGWQHYMIVVILLIVALIIKIMTWIYIDRNRGKYTRESALGLTDFGKAKPFEPAHSQKNYLQREMGYELSASRRMIMRWIALGFGFILPAYLLYVGFILAPIIALICLGGLMAERWLFFAEAEHVVRLYYDRDEV